MPILRVGDVDELPDESHAGRVVELDQHRRERDVVLGGAWQERSADHGEREDGTVWLHSGPLEDAPGQCSTPGSGYHCQAAG